MDSPPSYTEYSIRGYLRDRPRFFCPQSSFQEVMARHDITIRILLGRRHRLDL